MRKPSKPAKRRRPRQVAEDDILPEYDFSNAVRNPYARRFRTPTVMVVLEPDVALAFPNAKAVNGALRIIAEVARRTQTKRKAKRTT
jgi:hypothetical protein